MRSSVCRSNPATDMVLVALAVVVAAVILQDFGGCVIGLATVAFAAYVVFGND